MKKLVAFLVFGIQSSYAQQVTGEIELAGFQLGQLRTAIHHQLGAPIEKEITDDKWIYEFHLIKPDTSVYGLFKYAAWDTTRLYGFQLNGDSYEEMHPFKGFKIGFSKDKANQILGEVNHTKKIDDPPLIVQYYKDKNYSIEIDPDGKIFGIHIFGDVLETKPRDLKPTLHSFHDAVVKKSADSLLANLAPDVIIHKNGKQLVYAGAAREEFNNKESEFMKALLGPTESVWYALAQERAEGTERTKTDETAHEKHEYFDFFDSNIISQISYKPLAGKWRVSEITFRK
jgi:hypothetical protein